jgi:hypothetical protein
MLYGIVGIGEIFLRYLVSVGRNRRLYSDVKIISAIDEKLTLVI